MKMQKKYLICDFKNSSKAYIRKKSKKTIKKCKKNLILLKKISQKLYP